MGCEWNMPANYSPGVFEQCLGDSAEPMGVYGTSTFYQGEPVTPPAHPIPSSSSCTYFSTISNGQGVLIGGITSTVSTTSTPTSTTVTVGTHHTSHYHHHSCFRHHYNDSCTSFATIGTLSDVPASATPTSISQDFSSSILSPLFSSPSSSSSASARSSSFPTTSSFLQTSSLSSTNSPFSPSPSPSSSAPTLASSSASQSSSILSGQNSSQQCPLFAQGAAKSGSSSSLGSGAPISTSSSAALPTALPVGCRRLAVIGLTIVIGFSTGVIVTF